MLNNFPLVTIGIPVFNGAKYLSETLQSISKQTYKNLELIIIDDGSSDASFTICSQWAKLNHFPVCLLKNDSNLGLTKTCNIILRQAKGQYLQMFGQDDIMLPQKISNNVNLFEQQNENVAIIYSRVQLIDEASKLINQDYFERIGYKLNTNEDTFLELIKLNFISAPSVIMRTSIIKDSGGYDEDLQFEDWDLWLRLSREYQLLFSDNIDTYYRMHKGSMMADRNKEVTIIRNHANIRMFKKYLGYKENYDDAILGKIKELSIYSFFIGDKKAPEILKSFLKYKFDPKVWAYHKMAVLGIKHFSSFIRRA